MTLNATGLVFAHRFLMDRRVEFICMTCLAVVCNVRHEEDAGTHLDRHICDGENRFPGD
ncbi:MAG: hypothetical protein WA655_14375 [Candidatus Korobacteraceae bacterium]